MNREELQTTIVPVETEQEDGVKIEEYLWLFLSHWYWFVVALLISLGIAIYRIETTTPTFARRTQVLIKSDDGRSGGTSLARDFQQLGIGGSGIELDNEIITMGTPVLMEETVRRLGLRMHQSVAQDFHRRPLYHDAPLEIEIEGIEENEAASFNLQIKDAECVELSDFHRGSIEQNQHLTLRLGTRAHTPIGVVQVKPSKAWNKEWIGRHIDVRHIPLKNLAAKYAGRLNISRVTKESSVLNITLVDEVPSRADDILRTLIDVYNDGWIEDKNKTAVATNEFINERLATLTKELGDVDQSISDYKSASLIPNVDAASTMFMSESQRNTQQLQDLRGQLGMAQYIRDYILSMTSTPGENKLLPENSGIATSGIDRMISVYNTAILRHETLLSNTNADNVQAQHVQREIDAQREVIGRSLDNFIVQIQKQIAQWEAQEAKTNAKIAAAPQQMTQLLSVGRQQKVKEALYIYLLQKREETALSQAFTAWNTRVIQPPTGGSGPTAPDRRGTLLLAIALGLFIPAALLILRELLNHSVRSRLDLEATTSIPLVGEIPSLTGRRHFWQRRSSNTPMRIVVEKNNRNIANESFRLARTKIDYFLRAAMAAARTEPSATAVRDKGRVIMFTSFNVDVGKTFCSANLAAAFALKGKRVLLLDLDLRKGSLSALLRDASTMHNAQCTMHNGRHLTPHSSPLTPHSTIGITSYLNGDTDSLHDIVHSHHHIEGLHYIPTGIRPPNPAELLLSPRLQQLLEEAREQYDYILLDCPPIDIVTDANIIKDVADATLFVVRVGVMDRRLLPEVQKLYDTHQYPHMAFLLNGTELVRGRYGNYRYGYGYGYGYHYGGYGYGYTEEN